MSQVVYIPSPPNREGVMTQGAMTQGVTSVHRTGRVSVGCKLWQTVVINAGFAGRGIIKQSLAWTQQATHTSISFPIRPFISRMDCPSSVDRGFLQYVRSLSLSAFSVIHTCHTTTGDRPGPVGHIAMTRLYTVTHNHSVCHDLSSRPRTFSFESQSIEFSFSRKRVS